MSAVVAYSRSRILAPAAAAARPAQMVHKNLRPELPMDTAPQFRQLALLCWNADPARRARMDQLLPILEKLA